ncbi:hypothetical protein SAMN02745135_00905 [Caloranaerobacter azorensis DSM 13643]|uniref:Uncharacterized protein n=1 Tax=Caloranaerobacter azorensis DSM 13643 TaxID=1121264 RepID=A0A1M5T9Y7_9FIRM|nr:hypothetical protein [Caloranaerobacter azorensis]SHH47532.1 hypothetical protein SAMN02745135_00905 [Caloranaerobacter azorensis DSM 13643]
MNSNKINSIELPEELIEFKKIYLNNKDPIKRKVLSFSEVSYFMNKIIPLPINSNSYYKIRYEFYNNDEYLLLFLAYKYIIYKLLLRRINLYELKISIEDIIFTTNFIDLFFQYKSPILDRNSNIVWILPKQKMKQYIYESIYFNNFNNYYYEEETLLNLIYIIAGFAKYEYQNIEVEKIDKVELLNYPTLIFANIKLYEKGVIEIIEEDNRIGIVLNFNSSNNQNAIFSKNEDLLKKKILQVINKIDSVNYNINDFLN